MKKKEGNSGYRPFVPAVEQGSRVLICLGRSPKSKMTLTEICHRVGIHKSKGYSILNTLRQFGFVEKDPQTKTYSLGVGLVFLARNVLDNLDLRDVVEPFLASLANETFSTALFGLISAEQVFIVAKHEADHNVGVTIRLGHRFHITSGAHGKAIVAFMPDEERKRLLERDKLYFYGDASAMDAKRLNGELLECRRSGFAQDKGGLQPGINAVSAPVFGPTERIIGCVILIGTFSDTLMTQYGRKVADIVKRISGSLGADIDQVYKETWEGGLYV
jgi:DNA-binding IclR family transcriptional regulator